MTAPLTLPAFLALAKLCGAGVAPETLAGITGTESRFDPLAINVNGPGGGTVRGIRTQAQAIAKARQLIAQGKDFDAGISQINRRNWEWLGLTVESAFDPCRNIEAQANLLKSYSRYNTGSPVRGFQNGYVTKVVRQSASVREALRQPTAEPQGRPHAPSRPVAVALPAACAGGPPAWDTWGTARFRASCQRIRINDR